jgi:hypothetical protein
MCTVLLPPGVNPIAVNKYINIKFSIANFYVVFRDTTTAVTVDSSCVTAGGFE